MVFSMALGKEDPVGATQTDFVGDMLACVMRLSCGAVVFPHSPLLWNEVCSVVLSRKLRDSPRV